MKRYISLLLALLLIAFNIFATVSCMPEEEPEEPGNGSVTPGGGNEGGSSSNQGSAPVTPPDPSKPTYNSAGIIVPPYKDYGRGTKSFDTFKGEYLRPDTEALCAKFNTVSAMVRENAVPFEEQLAAIVALEPDYDSYYTMYALAEILSSKNIKDSYWAAEYEYISSTSPSLSQAIEELYVACACSTHVELFESDYFGKDIEEEYASGGRYTDAAVEYMAQEALLQSEYKALSPATVDISYNSAGVTLEGTYEEVLAELAVIYSSNSNYYKYASGIALTLYNRAYSIEKERIFIELLKVRALLAEELGYESYLEMAYHDMEYEYSPAQMKTLIADISTYVMPAYNLIYFPDFSTSTPEWKSSELINTGYGVAADIDSEFGEIYAYMLQHGLYDISTSSSKRLDGSFTTTLYTNNSPFMFITSSGYASDLSTVMHEFGHFIDSYVNNGSASALETAELCSQGLEFLSLIHLDDHVGKELLDVMTYNAILMAMDTLCYQGMLAAFEHEIYALSYDDITAERLSEIADEVAFDMLGYESALTLSDMLVLHLFIAPMYVQSYCTSILPALEIYLAELDGDDGVGLYKKVINREIDSFLSVLETAGLSKPFDDGVVERVINGLSGVASGIIQSGGKATLKAA